MTHADTIARPASRIWLLPAFLLIISAFTVGNLAVFVSTRTTHDRNRTVARSAMISIEEVGRIVHDIDQQRLLIDAHILETSTPQMQRIEQKLSAVEADMTTAAKEYEPLTTFPGEHAIWENLWQEVENLRPSIQRVLAFSRTNQDVQALAAMQILERNFAAINRMAERLIAVNRNTADDAVLSIEKLQRISLILLGATTLTGDALALFLAWRVMGIVKREDDQIAGSATLLEDRNRELDAFAGRVAHDLGGPLNALNLSVAVLSPHVKDQERLGVIHRSVRRMHELVHDLLALSRIDRSVSGAVAQTDQIAPMIEEELAPKVRSIDGRLKVDVEQAGVRCSETLLRQALWNIAENSTKYRRAEVPLEIDIQGRVADPFYEFRISDNGIGMSPDELPHIFEPFFRAAKTPSIPGTGLGLSIVKRIVEVNEGAISVNSRLDSGTTFMIRLPLARPASRTQVTDEERRAS